MPEQAYEKAPLRGLVSLVAGEYLGFVLLLQPIARFYRGTQTTRMWRAFVMTEYCCCIGCGFNTSNQGIEQHFQVSWHRVTLSVVCEASPVRETLVLSGYYLPAVAGRRVLVPLAGLVLAGACASAGVAAAGVAGAFVGSGVFFHFR